MVCLWPELCLFICLVCLFCVSPSSPSPVTQQMTAMSISQDSGAVDSDRAEADEGEEEGTSGSTGKQPLWLRPLFSSLTIYGSTVSRSGERM